MDKEKVIQPIAQPSLEQKPEIKSQENLAPHPEKKKVNNLLIVGMGALVLISLSLAGVLAYQNYQLKHKLLQIKTTPTTSVISSLPTQVLVPNKDWKVVIEKTVYKMDEIIPSPPPYPVTGPTYPKIEGTVFGPLEKGELACYYDVPPPAYLEKKEATEWTRLCDKNIEGVGALYCNWSDSKYNPQKGITATAILENSKNCHLQGKSVEEGIYRLVANIYTQCPIADESSEKVNPKSCQVKKTVISPEFEVIK